VKKRNESGSRKCLTDSEFDGIIFAAKNGTLRMRVITVEPTKAWRQDKPVETGWCDRNITAFGDEEDVTW
jgi:hypothetical protein